MATETTATATVVAAAVATADTGTVATAMVKEAGCEFKPRDLHQRTVEDFCLVFA